MSQPQPPSYGNVMDDRGKYNTPGFQSQGPYPPPQGAYPPPQGAYPPPQGAYPPPQGAYPPPQGAYPPPQAAYPPPGQGFGFSGQPLASHGQYPPQPAPGYVGSPAHPPPSSYDSAFVKPQATTDSEAAFADNEGLGAGASFSDKAIRRAFIKKVYLILMCQLLFTVGCVCCALFIPGAQDFMIRHSYIYYISYATFLVTYFTLVCCKGVRRKSPGNYICLFVFTLAFSYMTAMITGFYSTYIVLIALGITTAVCLSISLFAIQTKIDFTMCSGLLFAGCMVLIFFGFSCMIVSLTMGTSYILTCVYGALAALLFSLFLAYDTQVLIGGKKYELSPEEYITGSLQLYLDVVYLFLIILSFFGKGK